MTQLGPGRLYRRGDRWYGDWTDESGRRFRRSLGTDKRVAYRRLVKHVRERDLALSGMTLERGHALSLAELVDAYVAELPNTNAAQNVRLIGASLARTLVYFGQRKTLHTLTVEQVKGYRRLRLETVSKVTVNKDVQHLQAAIRAAGLQHPILALRALPSTRAARARTPRVLTDDESTRLLAACREKDVGWAYPQETLVFALLALGARWQEITRVGWEDYDVRGGWLHFSDRITKTSVPRTLPVPRSLAHRMALLPHTPGPIFKTWRGLAHPAATNNFRWVVLYPAMEKANIPRRTAEGIIHVHALRHTFCTRLARRGVPIQRAQYLTGHKSIRTLMTIYTHIQQDDVEQDRDAMDPELVTPTP